MTAISRFKITSRAVLLGLSLIAIPASATVAWAENLLDVAPKSTPPEINNFKLTEDFLARMEKIQEQLGSMELSATEDEGQDAAPSIDKMVASIEARPQVVDVLKTQNISPRDYIVGYFALMSSLAAADAEDEPQLVDELKDINPQHLAFGKKYSERIRVLIGE
ncbi:hypothetical protein [Brucella sp. 2716]|uniref:hypothetical protein n=1 Tax=Brucella sp. 2716 TaxID=2975052 RepID=UPI00217D4D7E|nr:hypothetical protein [Brucella sp. 2716]UWF58755.1 hypothetical protein NYO66_09420 [Brucella sp. 2716]